MIITYYGEGGFRVQNGELSLLVDAPNNRLKADVFLRTTVETNYFPTTPEEVVFPGEYEVKGIEIIGKSLSGEGTDKQVKTVYLVNWEGINLVFLGRAGQIPENQVLEGFDRVDILFVPCGGGEVLSAKDAAYVVKQLEPTITIPSFYKSASELTKALGQNGSTELLDKFVFKAKDLTAQQGKVLVLKVVGG